MYCSAVGFSDDKSVTTWSKGEYPKANNKEDDLLIISRAVGYRSDAVGNNVNSAAVIQLSTATSFNVEGLIITRNDVDYWQFDVPQSGRVKLFARPWTSTENSAGNNLDIRLELRDSQNTLVDTSNSGGTPEASITKQVSAGRYYAVIDGVGDSQYYPTDYGSIGQYYLQGEIPAGNVEPATTTKPLSSTTRASSSSTKASSSTTTLDSDITCPANDQYEPNNKMFAATQIFIGEKSTAIICRKDRDFYEAELALVVASKSVLTSTMTMVTLTFKSSSTVESTKRVHHHRVNVIMSKSLWNLKIWTFLLKFRSW